MGKPGREELNLRLWRKKPIGNANWENLFLYNREEK